MHIFISLLIIFGSIITLKTEGTQQKIKRNAYEQQANFLWTVYSEEEDSIFFALSNDSMWESDAIEKILKWKENDLIGINPTESEDIFIATNLSSKRQRPITIKKAVLSENGQLISQYRKEFKNAFYAQKDRIKMLSGSYDGYMCFHLLDNSIWETEEEFPVIREWAWNHLIGINPTESEDIFIATNLSLKSENQVQVRPILCAEKIIKGATSIQDLALYHYLKYFDQVILFLNNPEYKYFLSSSLNSEESGIFFRKNWQIGDIIKIVEYENDLYAVNLHSERKSFMKIQPVQSLEEKFPQHIMDNFDIDD